MVLQYTYVGAAMVLLYTYVGAAMVLLYTYVGPQWYCSIRILAALL
jgi:hypothetical protein